MAAARVELEEEYKTEEKKKNDGSVGRLKRRRRVTVCVGD
jgi:hypothetical protein